MKESKLFQGHPAIRNEDLEILSDEEMQEAKREAGVVNDKRIMYYRIYEWAIKNGDRKLSEKVKEMMSKEPEYYDQPIPEMFTRQLNPSLKNGILHLEREFIPKYTKGIYRDGFINGKYKVKFKDQLFSDLDPHRDHEIFYIPNEKKYRNKYWAKTATTFEPEKPENETKDIELKLGDKTIDLEVAIFLNKITDLLKSEMGVRVLDIDECAGGVFNNIRRGRGDLEEVDIPDEPNEWKKAQGTKNLWTFSPPARVTKADGKREKYPTMNAHIVQDVKHFYWVIKKAFKQAHGMAMLGWEQLPDNIRENIKKLYIEGEQLFNQFDKESLEALEMIYSKEEK